MGIREGFVLDVQCNVSGVMSLYIYHTSCALSVDYYLLTHIFNVFTINMNVGWTVGDEESVIMLNLSVSQKQRRGELSQNFAFVLIERI